MIKVDDSNGAPAGQPNAGSYSSTVTIDSTGALDPDDVGEERVINTYSNPELTARVSEILPA